MLSMSLPSHWPSWHSAVLTMLSFIVFFLSLRLSLASPKSSSHYSCQFSVFFSRFGVSLVTALSDSRVMFTSETCRFSSILLSCAFVCCVRSFVAPSMPVLLAHTTSLSNSIENCVHSLRLTVETKYALFLTYGDLGISAVHFYCSSCFFLSIPSWSAHYPSGKLLCVVRYRGFTVRWYFVAKLRFGVTIL